MIDYEVFQFAAPPGTGVSWFLKAMQLAGYGPKFRAKAFEGFEPFEGDHNVLKVSLVTHPIDWLYRAYLSFDKYSFVSGLKGIRGEEYESFSQFVGLFLERNGFVFKDVFDRYKADTVLRLEDMPWALIELLEAVGTDNRLLTKLSVLNGLEKYPVVSNDNKIRELVRQLDRDLFERYDYY